MGDSGIRIENKIWFNTKEFALNPETESVIYFLVEHPSVDLPSEAHYYLSTKLQLCKHFGYCEAPE